VPVAIVMAGGGPEPGLAPGLPNKAFLTLGGRPLIVHVLAALRSCAAVERIVVVGPTEPLAALVGPDVELVPEQGTMMHNVEAAMGKVEGAGHVLAVASDLPLLTGRVLDDFLGRCEPGADFYYPIVPQAVIEQRYPGARKTYVRVTDGTFAGGSALLLAADVIGRVRPFVEQILAARKKPWLLAQMFGWAVVMKFASGRLSIAELEARAYQITGIRARAVVVHSPELALDVDAQRPENLAVLQAALAGPERR
jgi:GTP:adenosylcobinamide-phosphate guanylyltransferase